MMTRQLIFTEFKKAWQSLLVSGFILWVASHIFYELAGDVWERETFVWDSQIALGIHSLSTPWLDRFIIAITWTGAELAVVFTVLLASWFWRQAERRRAVYIVLAVGGALLTSGVLKLIFQRPRPTIFTPLHIETSYSFPSGHTLTAIGFYGFAAILLWQAGHRGWAVASILWAGLVGLSRIYLGVHYPSDVLASFAVGAIWLVIVWFSFGRTIPQ